MTQANLSASGLTVRSSDAVRKKVREETIGVRVREEKIGFKGRK